MSHVITHIADPGAGVAEDHHGGAVVIINQGPEIRAGAHLASKELELEINVIKCLENSPLATLSQYTPEGGCSPEHGKY